MCNEDPSKDAHFRRDASVITTTGLWTKSKVQAVATATASPSCPSLQCWEIHVQKDSLSDVSLLAEFQSFDCVQRCTCGERANTDGAIDAGTRNEKGHHDTTGGMQGKPYTDEKHHPKESFFNGPTEQKSRTPSEKAVESVLHPRHHEMSTSGEEENKVVHPIRSPPPSCTSSSSCDGFSSPSFCFPPPSHGTEFDSITEVKLEGWEHQNWNIKKAPAQSGPVAHETSVLSGVYHTLYSPSSASDGASLPPCPTTTTTTTTTAVHHRMVSPHSSRTAGVEGKEPVAWRGKKSTKTECKKGLKGTWEEGEKRENEKNEDHPLQNNASRGSGHHDRSAGKEEWMEPNSIVPTDGLLRCLNACSHLASLTLRRCNVQSVLYSSLLPLTISRFGPASASVVVDGQVSLMPTSAMTGVDALWPFLSQLDRLCIQQEHSSSSSSSFFVSSRRSSHSPSRGAHGVHHSIGNPHAKWLQDPWWSFHLLRRSSSALFSPPPAAAFTWWLLLSCVRLRTLILTHTTHSAAFRMHDVGAVLSLLVERKASTTEEGKIQVTREKEEREWEVWKGWHLSVIHPERTLFFRRSLSEECRITSFCTCSMPCVVDSSSIVPFHHTACGVAKESTPHHPYFHDEHEAAKRIVLLGMTADTTGPWRDRSSSTDHRDYFPLSLSPSHTFRLFQITELDLSYTDVSSLTWMRRVWWPPTPSCVSISPFSVHAGHPPLTTSHTTDRHHDGSCGVERGTEGSFCVDAPKDAAEGVEEMEEEERAVIISTLPHLRVLRLVGCLQLHSLDSLFYMIVEEEEGSREKNDKETAGTNAVEGKRETSSFLPLPPLHLPHLHTLDISWSAVEDLDSLRCLASCSRGLRFFSMNGCQKVGDHHCLELFTELRILHAQHTMFSSLSWIDACQKLEEVDLQGCFLLEDVSHVASLPCLKTYVGPHLTCRKEVDDDDNEEKEKGRQKPITTLSIPLASSSHFSSLTSLQLQYPGSRDGSRYARGIVLEIESSLSALSSPLRSLILDDVPVRTLSFLSFFPQLEKLSLHCCRSLRKQPPTMRHSAITFSGYASAIETAHATPHVNITHRKGKEKEKDDEDDEEKECDIFSCIASLSHLQDLELSDLPLSYVHSFLFPDAPCTRVLQHLNISLCSGLHDITGISSCHQLRSVTLSDASLSDIHSELQHCPLLRAVHVSYLDLVDDVGFIATLPLLSELTIRRTDVKEVPFYVTSLSSSSTSTSSSLPPADDDRKESVDELPPAPVCLPPPPPHCTLTHPNSTLTELYLAECPLLSSLSSLTCLVSSLRSLHLHHIAVKALEGLEEMAVLEILHIESCANLTTIHPSASSSGASSSRSPESSSCHRPPLALQNLLLHRCPQLCGIRWMTAYAGAPLREVKIHDCPRIGQLARNEEERRKGTLLSSVPPAETETEEKEGAAWERALQTVVGNNSNLRVLEIVSSFTTCMKTVRPWLLPSTSLSSSSFSCHSELTEIRFSGLLSLTRIDGVEQLPHLTALSIAKCPRLHCYHALSRCPALVRLQLSACAGITNVFASLCDNRSPHFSSSSSSSSLCVCGVDRSGVHLQTHRNHFAGWRQEEAEESYTEGGEMPIHEERNASSGSVWSILPALEVLELSQLQDLTSLLPSLPLHANQNNDNTIGVRLTRPEEGEGREKEVCVLPSFSDRVPAFLPSLQNAAQQHETSTEMEGPTKAPQAVKEMHHMAVQLEAGDSSFPPLPPPPVLLHFLPRLHTLSISSCPQFQNVFSLTPSHFPFANDFCASSTSSRTSFTASSWVAFSSTPLLSTAALPMGSMAVSFASALQLQRVQLADLPMLQDIRWLSASYQDEMASPNRTKAHQTPTEASATTLSPSPSPTSFALIDALDVSFCPSLCSLDGVQSLTRLRSLSTVMCSMADLEPLRSAFCLHTLEEVDVSLCVLLKDASALLHPPPPLSSPPLPAAYPFSHHQQPARLCSPEQEIRSRKSLHSDPKRHSMKFNFLTDNTEKIPPQKYNRVLKRFRANGSGLQECKEDFTNKAHCPNLVECGLGEKR